MLRNFGVRFMRLSVTMAKLGCVWLIRGYQLGISPFLGSACRFYPSCSCYAIEAIEKHGVWRGGWFIVSRLCRCQPFSAGGVDLVPAAHSVVKKNSGGIWISKI